MVKRNLMAEILAKDNLNAAYKQVVRNKGAAGVDGMTCDDLLSHLKKHGEEKNPKTRYKNLVHLGVSEKNARRAASNLAYARICRSEPICFAISNERLEKFGLLSMEMYFREQSCNAS